MLYFVGNLGAGGLERFVTRISLRAKEGSDFEPAVCCLSERTGLFVEALEDSGVPVIQAPERWRRSLNRMRELAGRIKDLEVDLVHSQVNFSLAQQLWCARLAGVRAFCVTERNCYPITGIARLRRIAQFYAIRAMGARYSANAVAVAHHLARLVGAPVTTIGVLPNGVPIHAPKPGVRAAIREQLGWDADVMGIGYVSRMAEHKGHKHLIEAMALARDRALPIRACLVGDGPQRRQLEEMIDRLKLGDHIRLTGVVPNVDDYLEAFDVVALMSSREGMANALLEAMAAGKAVVANKAGANAEVLNPGEAGVILDDVTPESVVGALQFLVECPERRAALGEAARLRAESVYSVEACYRRLLSHYADVLGPNQMNELNGSRAT